MIAAMDIHGMRRHTLVDGGVKGHDFLDFVQRVLGRRFAPARSW